MREMNNNFHYRKPTRYKNYDYNQPGYYFITTCVKDRIELFGAIKDGEMSLTDYGNIVNECWQNIPKYYSNCELDCYVIMPDHLHGIIIVHTNIGDGSPVPSNIQGETKINEENKIFPTAKIGSIINMIAYFKYQSTREINRLLKSPGMKIWQRSFYDRIIRNEKELYNIRKYIEQNPLA